MKMNKIGVVIMVRQETDILSEMEKIKNDIAKLNLKNKK